MNFLRGHAQLNSGPLSKKKKEKKILCCTFCFKCYCFCLLILETQIVQLENLAFFLGSPQNTNQQKLFMHSSKCTNGYSELINIDICNRRQQGRKIFHPFFQ
ncbi:unnamed protein product [Pipistrellus nathusii]|uniref:Uncharacterized protein n=1 Tax=Pipistrellus nathusii TaxID=59473 RepID=A0ABN9Z424_PIPNA